MFHTTSWLQALRETYGFEPIAFTSSPPEADLREAIVFCEVNSWLTGKRLVSLPYSDHCELLAGTPLLQEVCEALRKDIRARRLRYIELRPIRQPTGVESYCSPTNHYRLHLLDLTRDLATIYRQLHKDSIQRKIQRAAREGLRYEEGRSGDLLDTFYRLHTMTRRRHGVPVQPLLWFQNLIRFFGDSLKIRVAMFGERAAAAILTIRHKDTLVYKYGCGDVQLNPKGGTQMLFWRAIEDAKAQGLKVFDLGRSDITQEGLIQFKDRWGSEALTISYFRSVAPGIGSGSSVVAGRAWQMQLVSQLSAHLPGRILAPMNRFLFRHGA